jgi:hypothetical protein
MGDGSQEQRVVAALVRPDGGVVAEDARAPAHGDLQDGVRVQAGLRRLAQEIGERGGASLGREGVVWRRDRRHARMSIGVPVCSLEREWRAPDTVYAEVRGGT